MRKFETWIVALAAIGAAPFLLVPPCLAVFRLLAGLEQPV